MKTSNRLLANARERRVANLVKRAGKDPLSFKGGSLSSLMNDVIPEYKWKRQASILRRMGYNTYQELFRDRGKPKVVS